MARWNLLKVLRHRHLVGSLFFSAESFVCEDRRDDVEVILIVELAVLALRVAVEGVDFAFVVVGVLAAVEGELAKEEFVDGVLDVDGTAEVLHD